MASLHYYLNCPLLPHSTFYPGPFKGKALSKPEQYKRLAGGRFFLPVASPGAPATAQTAADGGGGGGFKRAGGRRCQLQRRDCCRNTEQGSGALLLEDGGEGARDTGDPLLADACRSHHARGRQTGLLSSVELKTNPKKTGLFNVIHSGYKYIKHYVFGD